LSVLYRENKEAFVVQKTECKLTVFFEDPFWVGIYERIYNGRMEVCKITFGAEPKDYEVYAFLLENWSRLRFSPPVRQATQYEKRQNPKRIQREIQKSLESRGVGTKAQQALKLQQEEGKLARKQKSREQREVEKNQQFALRMHKKKEKHKGH